MQSGHAGTKLLILVLQHLLCRLIVVKEFHNNNFLVNRGIAENNFIVFLQMTYNHSRSQRTRLLKLAFWSRFFPCDEYMRDEYLIRNTHRTFRAWLLPFSFVGGQP
jgi:hypothetical protein